MPKVSVLMPACNVEKYINECMDSVLGQTLREIEIICIDDGSKDRTGAILDEYAANDERLKVVHKENTGYGHSMNVALSMATGDYIGIVETDDYIEPNMFEVMYSVAIENNVDTVKTNYYNYYSKEEVKNKLNRNLDSVGMYNKVFAPKDHQNVFMVAPSIWSGIYRAEMIKRNNIKFTETPGASYQDTGFAFKIWACAQSVYLLEDAFLHYRRDNDNSSVNSPRKVFCVCDEYDEINKFLTDKKKAEFIDIKNARQFDTYRWNYNRLGVEYRYAFLRKIEETFNELYEKGELKKSCFKEGQWEELEELLNDSQSYFLRTSKKKLGGKTSVEAVVNENKKLKEANKELKENNKSLKRQIKKMKESRSYQIGRAITALPRKIKKAGR